MHPPLDRPHDPGCVSIIRQLRACHDDWTKKFFGECNSLKTELDRCLKLEKRRLLEETDREWETNVAKQQELVMKAFGKKQTFAEYLQQDPDYLEAKRDKEEQEKRREEATA